VKRIERNDQLLATRITNDQNSECCEGTVNCDCKNFITVKRQEPVLHTFSAFEPVESAPYEGDCVYKLTGMVNVRHCRQLKTAELAQKSRAGLHEPGSNRDR